MVGDYFPLVHRGFFSVSFFLEDFYSANHICVVHTDYYLSSTFLDIVIY